ncbi:hypothetical protein DTO195F2_7348 [Paecilomyces variotii]|nr:hypothetical protein DTO195F2_7348 [Paecilomyces variotii]KAJ9367906.1 hypothetical protein DTO282E5_7412 [Paecilomyces variotii]
MVSTPGPSAIPRSDPVHVPSLQEIPSSPPSIVSEAGTRRKPKRPPPVTPRSFRRFFTPRSLLNAAGNTGNVKTSRQALKELSSPVVNRLGPAFTRIPKGIDNRPANHASTELTRTPSTKRKFSISSLGSPQQSSPLRKVRIAPRIHEDVILERPVDEIHIPEPDREAQSRPEYGLAKALEEIKAPAKPIRRSVALQTSGQLYMRSIGTPRANRTVIRSTYGTGWQDQTSNFYTRADDLYSCVSHTEDRLSLPFCIASCNTNTLVAVGDEEGGIRLLESAKNDKTGFSKAYLTFRPHGNAIMDLEFSADDKLLATASGDQTTLVIDMATQKPVYCLSNHVSSVKRVQFQPASNGNVIATCSRDGDVNIWDLRCKGFERPSLQARCSLDSDIEDAHAALSPKMKYPQVLNSIHGAHAWMPPRPSGTERAESQIGRQDISVTSLAFLPPGRENLFVTASEANACVRLWDLRTAYNIRRGRPVPLSTTREPDSHVKYRRFGLTSMTFGGDGSRLYTLCKDGTVYAYSTAHLILGHAPELALNNTRPRRSGGPDKEGLGPLYGFRHPRLQVASFYVKTAIRKAADDKGELLAVGSSDHCAVLFPTDERFHQTAQKPVTDISDMPLPATRSCLTRAGLRRTNSGAGLFGRLEDTIPIYQNGTALIEGHKKEVSAVSWTTDGELITVSDDYSARCWREGPDARDLRTGGETEGRRWNCGWADSKDSYDDEEE